MGRPSLLGLVAAMPLGTDKIHPAICESHASYMAYSSLSRQGATHEGNLDRINKINRIRTVEKRFSHRGTKPQREIRISQSRPCHAGFKCTGIDGLKTRPLRARLRESCFCSMPLSRSEYLRDKSVSPPCSPCSLTRNPPLCSPFGPTSSVALSQRPRFFVCGLSLN